MLLSFSEKFIQIPVLSSVRISNWSRRHALNKLSSFSYFVSPSLPVIHFYNPRKSQVIFKRFGALHFPFPKCAFFPVFSLRLHLSTHEEEENRKEKLLVLLFIASNSRFGICGTDFSRLSFSHPFPQRSLSDITVKISSTIVLWCSHLLNISLPKLKSLNIAMLTYSLTYILSLCFWVSFLPSHVWTSYTHIGTMGPATAWENSQETWLQWRLQPSEISKLSEFTPGRSTYAPEKHRITISDSISQHRFTS